MTDKSPLLDRIRDRMAAQLARLREAVGEARAAATDPDSKAEGKYDTRSLEASYLAAGQLRQLAETERQLQLLESFRPRPFDLEESIDLGALVEIARDDCAEYFLLVPAGGGLTLAAEDREITLLSPESPLYRELLGKRLGDALADGGWIAEIE